MSPLSECIWQLARLGRQRRQRLFREWLNSLGDPSPCRIPEGDDGDDDGDDYQGVEPPSLFGPAMTWAA
jgi:hypothetical protein